MVGLKFAEGQQSDRWAELGFLDTGVKVVDSGGKMRFSHVVRGGDFWEWRHSMPAADDEIDRVVVTYLVSSIA